MTQRDGMRRREEGSGWGTHVYLWQIHFDIWQNQYNIVKLNKIKFKKKIQYRFGSPNHGNQRIKRNKNNPDWKRKIKALTVCRRHDIVHKDASTKLSELIYEYSKVTGYNINTRNLLHSYTNNVRY